MSVTFVYLKIINHCLIFKTILSDVGIRYQFISCNWLLLYLNFNTQKFICNVCVQDYHWWWRSFLTSGFTAFYLFIYCVHYFVTKLNIEDAASTFLYFGYTLIMVYLFFLLTGNNCVHYLRVAILMYRCTNICKL